jgi:hypothetical protein
MPFSVSKSINEADVAATLRLVLQEVVRQNRACTVLTRSSIQGLGTHAAKVVLTFDDASCQQIAQPST